MPAYCLTPTGSSLKGVNGLTCPRRCVKILLMVGIVVPAKLQVGELAGGVGNRMLRLDLYGGFLSSAHQSLQIHGDLIGYSFCIGIHGSAVTAALIIKRSGCGRTVSFLDTVQCVQASTDLLLDLIDMGSGSLFGIFHTLVFRSNDCVSSGIGERMGESVTKFESTSVCDRMSGCDWNLSGWRVYMV